MTMNKEPSLEDKIKLLETEQQLYIKGLVDGALLHKGNPMPDLKKQKSSA